MPFRQSMECSHSGLMTLNAPHSALKSTTVAKLMEQRIAHVGQNVEGYTAKSYRPTGAMYSIDANIIDPEIVMKMGRWHTKPLFYDHYIQSETPVGYSAQV